MRLQTPSTRARPVGLVGDRVASGFTLVEMILVLALLALMATVTVTGARAISDATGEADAESAVQTAIAAARRAAVTSGNVTTVHATDEAWGWDGGSQHLPTGDTRVILLPAQTDGLSLIGGEAMEKPIEQVNFYPDGTCDAFRVQFKRKQGGKIITIDPWSGATLQPPSDARP